MQDNGLAAAEANLRYVNDGEAGISRIKRIKGFSYVFDSGGTVEDAATSERISFASYSAGYYLPGSFRALSEPPAYSKA